MSDTSMSNRLAVLAGEITDALQAIRSDALRMAERALSLGRALAEAKAALPHGSWESWLGAHTGISTRTAQRYMKLAASGLEPATVADLGLRGAEESLAKKVPDEDVLLEPGVDLFLQGHDGSFANLWRAEDATDGQHRYDFFILLANGLLVYPARGQPVEMLHYLMEGAFDLERLRSFIVRRPPEDTMRPDLEAMRAQDREPGVHRTSLAEVWAQ